MVKKSHIFLVKNWLKQNKHDGWKRGNYSIRWKEKDTSWLGEREGKMTGMMIKDDEGRGKRW